MLSIISSAVFLISVKNNQLIVSHYGFLNVKYNQFSCLLNINEKQSVDCESSMVSSMLSIISSAVFLISVKNNQLIVSHYGFLSVKYNNINK